MYDKKKLLLIDCGEKKAFIPNDLILDGIKIFNQLIDYTQ